MNKIETAKKLIRIFSPKPWPLEKPVVIQFPVNDICNSKCQMCHIWKQKRDYEISPNELREALKDSLYTNVSNVGINGGEPTLREDLPELASAIFEANWKNHHTDLILYWLGCKKIQYRKT